jgi:hypothetical protein
MKVSLVIGGVEVTLSGVELTLRQVKELMRSAGSIALALPREPDATLEVEKGHPIGFTASLELDSERHVPHGPDWYDDEE